MAARKSPAEHLDRLREIARERGGELLSKVYKGDLGKLRFRCAVGHQWLADAGHIKQGRWCPPCGRVHTGLQRRRLGERKLLETIEYRGGKMLTPYVTSQVKQRYRCAEGHEWEAVPASILQGTWCPRCADPLRHGWRKERVFRRVQDLARAQGGDVLSESFEGQAVPLLLRCARGHRWQARAASITQGVWCPVCKEFDWLEVVRARAKENGGRCLSLTCSGWADRLQFECILGHRWSAEAVRIKRGHWCPRCRSAPSGTIEQMRAVAHERGGECLSARYVDHVTKLRWRCAEGHEWSARPQTVVQGSWCRICRRGQGIPRRFLGLEVMQRIAHERGGECLSEEYYGIYDRLRWRCARGHEWVSRANNVRRGNWCPQCSHGTPGTLERMRLLALERGGRLITRHWNDRKQPLLFECARGHRFKSPAAPIKTGVWCPLCAALLSTSARGAAQISQTRRRRVPRRRRPRAGVTTTAKGPLRRSLWMNGPLRPADEAYRLA
jgi:hypothetical protein